MTAISFWAFTLVCCGYGAVFGGRDGRRIAVIYIIACFATLGAFLLEAEWTRTHIPTLVVDFGLLLALLPIALRTRRWFPVWFAGLHLAAVVSHFGAWLAPGFAMEAYFFLQSLWAVPMLLVLAIGAEMDRRKGIHDAEYRTGQPERHGRQSIRSD